MAEKIVNAMRKPFPLRDRVAQVTASVGLAVFPEDGEDADTLMKNAAAGARERARERRQPLPVLGPDPQARPGVDPLELEVGLRAALSRGQMSLNGVPAQPGTLFYQPFYALATGKVAGVEALLRWQHPHLGLVFPQDFLSKSDFAGLILAIGPWILRTACLQARSWQRRHRGLRLAVNLSTPEMLRHDLVEQVEDALEGSGLAARSLQVEIPESHVMRDLPRFGQDPSGPQGPWGSRSCSGPLRRGLLLAEPARRAPRGRGEARPRLPEERDGSSRRCGRSSPRWSRSRAASDSGCSPRGSRTRPSSPCCAGCAATRSRAS